MIQASRFWIKKLVKENLDNIDFESVDVFLPIVFHI